MTGIIARESIALPDGRTLSYLEAGDRDGVPALFTIGTPSTAVGGLAFASAAAINGVRLVSIDKPGFGDSSPDPDRSVLRYGHDVSALADALGFERVALVGQSGGGPQALAAAYVLGSRVSTLTLLSSFGPASEPWAREDLAGLMTGIMWLARHAPSLVSAPVGLMKLAYSNRERAGRLMGLAAKKASPAERAALSGPEAAFILDGASEAMRSGPAASDEFRSLGRPWGFRLEDVQAQTDLWHGVEDKSCSIGLARGMANRLPNATLHELPGVGHGFFDQNLSDAMANLRAKASV